MQQPSPPETNRPQLSGETSPGDALSGETPPGQPVPPQLPDPELPEDSWRITLGFLPSWLASLVLHLLLVLILATTAGLVDVPKLLAPVRVTSSGDLPIEAADDDLSLPSVLSELPDPDVAGSLSPADLTGSQQIAADLDALLPIAPEGAFDAGLGPGLEGSFELGDADGLGQRSSDSARRLLVMKEGGNEHSERAVGAALNWLARHQLEDGHWSFTHTSHPDCNGKCDHPGGVNSNVAATAIALLPFLGTGETHQQGHYRENVRRGIDFLVTSIRNENKAGSLWDPQGNMYGHGLASIVLCEAYAMTHDGQLRAPAQSVLNFIVNAQDQNGGGWRYQPGMPGDTSVLGWQLMALKSGHMADLRVPGLTFRRTTKFLNHVQADDGAAYGYEHSEAGRPATTAIGLLCRMYLGWSRSNRTLQRGVLALGKQGPSAENQGKNSNLYYNYYGTQVMHHWGGEPWRQWNLKMRDFLIATQAKDGHAKGSWYFDGDHGSGAGGRLYCTAMSAMILEVYYRHLPIYGQRSIQQ